MSSILIVGEHENGKLNGSIAKCVTCAQSIRDAKITIVVLAADGAEVCAQAAAIAGVANVVRVDHPSNAHALAAVQAPQIAALASPYTHVFGPSTTFGKDLMPRIAALLDAPQLSDIMAAESATRFRRPTYAGNAIVTVEVTGSTKIVATVRLASFEAAPAGGSAPIEMASVTTKIPAHTRFVSLTGARGNRPDLQSAAKVVAGGRALASAENFKIIAGLADRIGAALAASRAAVDAGYAPNELQVGQTGKVIAPALYIAIGISGAIQHLTGIKDAGTIVAINKDPEAPIFELADFGLLGDLFDVVPEIEALLRPDQ
jgi:electron transfer flavoprotein alpha subunit